MYASFAKKSLATLLLAAVAACSAGSGTSSVPYGGTAPRGAARPAAVPPLLSRIVGVGDSLTAGYQAGGFLGQTGFANPLLPGAIVPPGQENGWWADLDEQASGLPIPTAIAQMYDPAVSPLPLIAAPGLNNQLVAAPPPAPFGVEKSGNACSAYSGFNAAGYLLSGVKRVRMNPSSRTIRDVGVPGITLHEANVLAFPQTNTCQALPGVPGLLSEIVAGESSTFWPVLGTFSFMGTRLTMVNAAAYLHPTLATVWLGANDLLKFMGSGGRFTGGDATPAQAELDLKATILTLKAVNSKVVVANLPDVLKTPYFMRVSIPPHPNNPSVCNVQTYVYCLLRGFGFADPLATQLVTEIAQAYNLDTPSGCTPATTTRPCGYLTLQGALAALSYYLVYFSLPNLDCPTIAPKCTPVPGNGLGQYYITPHFAAEVQQLNDNMNAGIDAAAKYYRSPLVDVRAIFDGIASGDPNNQYYQKASTIKNGVCCTLAAVSTFPAKGPRGGLVSFDGLHPSNTGYALIAFYFIRSINTHYQTNIPEIDVRAAYHGTRCSVPAYCFPDPYAPHFAGQGAMVRSGRTGITLLR